MSGIFTSEQIESLSLEIDRQLQEIQQTPQNIFQKNGAYRGITELDRFFEKQLKAIEDETKQPSRSFLKKFYHVAKKDICEKDGLLYKQWEKWGDLSNKDTLKILGGVLAIMGLTGEMLRTVVVAVSVIVIHLGIKAFCEEFTEKEKIEK